MGAYLRGCAASPHDSDQIIGHADAIVLFSNEHLLDFAHITTNRIVAAMFQSTGT